MNNTPHIYIVTPCFNAAKTLENTIKSIISQAGDFIIHYHIQDGKSTDNTSDILYYYSQLINNKKYEHIYFTSTSEKDNGMYDAITKGFNSLSIPQNALMGWLNADDTLCPGVLAKLCSAAKAFPHFHWFGGIPLIIEENGVICLGRQDYSYPQDLLAAGACDGLHWRTIQQEGTFWKKWLWDTAGGLDSSFRLAGDWDLWRRMAKYEPYIQFTFPMAAFHRRTGQLSSNIAQYHAEIEQRCPYEERKNALRLFIKHIKNKFFYSCEYHEKWIVNKHRYILSKKDYLDLFFAQHGLYFMHNLCIHILKIIKRISRYL